MIDDEHIVRSSKDGESTPLEHLRKELEIIKENLDQELEEVDLDVQTEEVEIEEIIEAKDEYKESDPVAWVDWDFIIYFPESTIDEIGREGPNINRTKHGNLRHEYAHLVDLHFNNDDYDPVNPESTTDIKNAPKEAYAIFEELRVSSDHDGGYPFLRGGTAAPHWHSFVEVDSSGEINWIENNDPDADYSPPHTLGYYAAKTLEEAENKKCSDRAKAENEVRKRLLQTATVDGLISEISRAHEELGHPFYLDILEDISSQVADLELEEVERRLDEKTEKYEDKSDIGLEEYFQDYAFLESSKSIFEESLEYEVVKEIDLINTTYRKREPDSSFTEAVEKLEESLTGYGVDGNYQSEHIIIDEGSETSDEYLEWLPN